MPASLQLQINEPCHENWQSMTPNEQGRFCGSCQKIVVDFSVMTDKEILDHISKASHGICGRVSHDQLNKDIREPDPKKRFSFVYVWNLLLATLLFTKANAQICPPKSKKPPVTKVPEEKIMGEIVMPKPEIAVVPVTAKGTVVDASNNAPVEGASIHIKQTTRGTVADSAGAFSLSFEQKEPVEIEISAIGYETQTLQIDNKTNWQHIKISLKPLTITLGEVAVTGYGSKSCTRFVGGIGYVRKVSRTEKMKRLMPAVLKKDVKAFPNPATRGNSIQVSLALKETGEYKLELLDASGKVVLFQSIQMPVKERIVSISTSEAWSTGVYWIRISGKHVKNVYQNKILIQ